MADDELLDRQRTRGHLRLVPPTHTPPAPDPADAAELFANRPKPWDNIVTIEAASQALVQAEAAFLARGEAAPPAAGGLRILPLICALLAAVALAAGALISLR